MLIFLSINVETAFRIKFTGITSVIPLEAQEYGHRAWGQSSRLILNRDR